MSSPKTNFELNNNARMTELTKYINHIFGYVLLYTVIIFTTLSALFGGVVVYPIYAVICIIKKIREKCCTSASEATNEATSNEVEEAEAVKKPIIDETWCNISVKNIINYTSEVTNEVEENEVEENEIAEASEVTNEVVALVNLEEEILSIRRPSEEELKQFQEQEEESEDESEAEAEDSSPYDKYSIGHYKSKTNIKDPLDFVEY